jgi:pheromone shutdown protein TraB
MVIRLLGTSHISSKSVQAIRKEIKNNQPDIVAVELDIGRAQTLQAKNVKKGIPWEMLPKVGLFGFMFVIMGRFVQEHLGKIVGVEPGSEMKEALVLSAKSKARIALIDRPILLTLRSLSKQFGWGEKLLMVWDVISAPFVGRKRMQEMGLGGFDLSGVPTEDVILKMTGHLKKRYPGMYKALISERDVYMSKALIHVLNKEMKSFEVEAEVKGENDKIVEPVILAVVGAGHLDGMKKYLSKKKVKFEVVDY